MFRICIAGNSGHAATVTRALPRLPQVEIAGWCRAWDGEPMTEVLEDFVKLGLTPPEFPDWRAMLDEVKPDVIKIPLCTAVCPITEAMRHKTCDVPLDRAAGMTAGEYVWAYPPGVPVLVPGERIDESTAETVRFLEKSGSRVVYTGAGHLTKHIKCVQW